MNKKYNCPHCDKTIIENNKNNFLNNDLIIKSNLVFLNEDGKVLCKCSGCKKTISLPLDYCKSTNKINENESVDL